jgi:hypothetical protein
LQATEKKPVEGVILVNNEFVNMGKELNKFKRFNDICMEKLRGIT